MKGILKLKKEDWDGKGTSLYEAKVESSNKSTTISVFIGGTKKSWSVSIYVDSPPHLSVNKSIDIKLFKDEHPTKESCLVPAMIYAYEFVQKQKNKLIAKIAKDFSQSLITINEAYLEKAAQEE